MSEQVIKVSKNAAERIKERSFPLTVSVRIDADAREIAQPSPSKLKSSIFLSLLSFK